MSGSIKGGQEGRDTGSVRSTGVKLTAGEASTGEQCRTRIGELNALFSKGLGVGRDSEARELFERWMAVDPDSALNATLRNLTDKSWNPAFLQLAGPLMADWATRDPQAAGAFLQKYISSPQAIELLVPSMMGTYGSDHPQKAMQWVTSGFSSDSSELRSALASELVKVLALSGQRDQVREWLARPEIATSAYGQSAAAKFARIMAEENPAKAIEFSEALPRGSMSRGLTIREAARQWALRDPDSAYQWLDHLLRKAEVLPGFPGGGVEQAQVVPQGAFTPTELDDAVAGYVLGVFRDSPETAYDTLDAIENSSMRARLQNELQQSQATTN